MAVIDAEGPDEELLESQEVEVEEDQDEGDESEATEDDDAEEGDDEDGEDGEEAEGDDPEPKPKKEGRYAVLARRAKQAEEEAKRTREQFDQLQRQVQQQLQGPARAQWEAAERAKVEAMLPEERLAYQTQQQLQAMQHTLAQVQFQSAEAAERAEFAAKASVNPAYAKYADRVEKMKQDFLRDGKNVSRENILRHLIGEDALARGTKAGAKQRASGAARKAAAKGRPVSGRGDQASGGRAPKSLEEKLADVYI